MGQITIYIDDQTLKQIEAAAHEEHDSVSKWVKKRLIFSLKKSWPKDYMDLFGSLKESSLKRPAQPKLKKDIKRQSL